MSSYEMSEKKIRDPYDGRGHTHGCEWLLSRGLHNCDCEGIKNGDDPINSELDACDCPSMLGEDKWIHNGDSHDGTMSAYKCRYCGKEVIV